MTTIHRASARSRRRRVAGPALSAAVALTGLGALGAAGTAAAAPATPSAVSTPTASPPVAVGAAVTAPAGARDLGVAPAATPLHLDVVLRPRDPATLAAFVQAVSTPGSPQYRQYLAKGQFASRFGPTTATIDAVRGALAAGGLHVGRVASDGLVLPVAATAAQVDRVLGARIDTFRLASGGLATANVTAPHLPGAVASAVQAVVGLDGLDPSFPTVTSGAAIVADDARASGIHPDLVKGQPAACSGANGSGGLTAPNIAQAYDLSPLYAAGDFGAGQSIDLFEQAPYFDSDIVAYQRCYGTNVPIKEIGIDGGPSGQPSTGNGTTEVLSDVDDVVSLAPKLAHVYIYETPNGTGDWIDEWNAMATADNAKIVSSSWATCANGAATSGLSAAEEPIFAMMASQGQSLYSSSGDNGTQECSTGKLGVLDPSSDPDVTGVGGTNLDSAASPGLGNPPGAAAPEVAWTGSGGGLSPKWTMPSYQSSATPGVINRFSSGSPCHAAHGADCREVPDVSADAGIGYAVLVGDSQWAHIGGTSLATPTWAAITALTDDSSPSCRAHPVGFVNPALYKLAVSTPDDFNDITVGNNADGNPALHGDYPATTGYDLATGLGTPVGANLAQSLCQVPLWTPQTTGPFALSGSTSVAASGRTVYVAYEHQTGSSPADIEVVTYNGTSWSSPTTVDPGGTPAETVLPPAVAVAAGKVYVAWTAAGTDDVESSSLAGGVWSTPIGLGDGLARSSAGPSLSSSGSSVFGTYRGRTGEAVYVTTYTGGSAWSAQTVVPGATTPYRPAIVLAPDLLGNELAWTTPTGTIETIDDSIFGFGSVKTIPGGSNAGPALAVLGARLYATWKGTRTDGVFYSSATTDHGLGAWTSQQTVPEALTLQGPTLAAAGSTLYSAWAGRTLGTFFFSEADLPSGDDYFTP